MKKLSISMNDCLLLFAIFLFVFFQRCTPQSSKSLNVSTDKNRNQNNTAQTEGAEKAEIKFILMNFTMDKKEGGERIALSNYTIKNGMVKDNYRKELIPGFMLCVIQDQGRAELKKIVFPHPLHQHFEYPNDKNQFESKTLSLEQASFSIMFAFDSSMKYLSFQEILENRRLSKPVTVEFNL